MLKALEIKSDAREKFNEFISTHPKGHILQSYEWGEIKGATDWQPLRYLFVDDNEVPVGAISILKRRIPGIGKSIFYAPRGPVWDTDDEAVLADILREIRSIAKRHKAIFLKIDPDVVDEDGSLAKTLRRFGFRSASTGDGFEGVQPKYVFRLDISASEEEVLAAMASKTRYNIRLAGRRGVEIKSECDENDLEVFYRILLETCERDGFLVRSYDYFLTIWREMAAKGLAKLFMASYEDEYIAGTLALTMGEKTWYLYGASSNRHRNTMPNYLLQWSMIQWAKENGSTLYDFRGVPGDVDEDHPLYGLIKFKRGFSGIYTEFVGEYDLIYSGFYYRLWKYGEPVYQKLVRRLIRFKNRKK